MPDLPSYTQCEWAYMLNENAKLSAIIKKTSMLLKQSTMLLYLKYMIYVHIHLLLNISLKLYNCTFVYDAMFSSYYLHS